MSISSVNGVASTVSRYRFVAAGGETSLTGTDANGATLSYLVGKEEVYLNGALLVRGQDYTGTDGATISSLTALVAGDTVEIITFVPFAIPTAISSATVTTQGDLIVATGASAVTRLGVGSSGQILTSNGTTPAYTSTVTGTLNNGTLTGTLTAASSAGTSGQLLSSTGTGVQWVAAPAAGSMTLLNGPSGTALSGSSVTISSISQSYKNLLIYISGVATSTGGDLYIKPNGTDSITSFIQVITSYSNSGYGNNNYGLTKGAGFQANNIGVFTINNYTSATLYKNFTSSYVMNPNGSANTVFGTGTFNTTSAITSLLFVPDGGTIAGTVLIYGVN